jgi:hypothetical protein
MLRKLPLLLCLLAGLWFAVGCASDQRPEEHTQEADSDQQVSCPSPNSVPVGQVQSDNPSQQLDTKEKSFLYRLFDIKITDVLILFLRPCSPSRPADCFEKPLDCALLLSSKRLIFCDLSKLRKTWRQQQVSMPAMRLHPSRKLKTPLNGNCELTFLPLVIGFTTFNLADKRGLS